MQSPRYFAISSRLKALADKSGDPDDMEESGFVPVIKFILHDLHEEQERIITHRCGNRLSTEANNLQGELKNRTALYAEKTGEELRRIDEDLAEKEMLWREWQNSTLPKLQREFDADLQKLTTATFRVLKLSFGQAGEIAQEAERQIEECQDVQTLKAGAETLMKGIVDLSLDKLVEIQTNVTSSFSKTVSRIEKEFAVTMPLEIQTAIVPYDTSARYGTLPQSDIGGGEFGKITGKIQRAMWWSTMAGVASSFVLPGLGPILVAGLGGLVAWFIGDEEQKEMELAQIKRKLNGEVCKQLSKLTPQAEEVVSNLLADGKRRLFEGVSHISKLRLSSLDRERKEILKVRQDSVEERKRREESFRVMDATLSAGLADLNALLKDSTQT